MAREKFVLREGKWVTKSIDGVVTPEYSRLASKQNPFTNYGSDNLPGGVNGILNHADGKRYDSKSKYNQAVVASGCRVVGNDMNGAVWKPPIERGIQGDFNVRPALKQAIEKVLG